MRFKLTLQIESKISGREIPINYQYELSSAIYKIIANGDEQYSKMLHKEGFVSNTKHFKLFTFSNLIAPYHGIELKKGTDRLIVKTDTVDWYLGFFLKESTQRFFQGVFKDQRFRLADDAGGAWFKISEIQLMPSFEFTKDTMFETISPITVTKKKEGEKFGTYMNPSDPAYCTGLMIGLIERYKAIYGTQYTGEQFCRLTLISAPKSTLITIKAGTPAETRIRGYRYRFKIDLPRELMEIMYECGLGERCSMGFGMVRAI